MFEKHPEVRKKWKLRKIFSELIWDFELSSSAIHIRIARKILHLPLELLKISKNMLKIKISVFQKYSAIEVWDYSFPEAKSIRVYKLIDFKFKFKKFEILKIFEKKKLYPEFGLKNVRKTSRNSKKMKIEKNFLSTHMSFWTFVKCNPYQNRK